MALTMKQLSEMTDEQVIVNVLNERLNKLTNVYTPFSQRLEKIATRLSYEIITKKDNIKTSMKDQLGIR